MPFFPFFLLFHHILARKTTFFHGRRRLIILKVGPLIQARKMRGFKKKIVFLGALEVEILSISLVALSGQIFRPIQAVQGPIQATNSGGQFGSTCGLINPDPEEAIGTKKPRIEALCNTPPPHVGLNNSLCVATQQRKHKQQSICRLSQNSSAL